MVLKYPGSSRNYPGRVLSITREPIRKREPVVSYSIDPMLLFASVTLPMCFRGGGCARCASAAQLASGLHAMLKKKGRRAGSPSSDVSVTLRVSPAYPNFTLVVEAPFFGGWKKLDRWVWPCIRRYRSRESRESTPDGSETCWQFGAAWAMDNIEETKPKIRRDWCSREVRVSLGVPVVSLGVPLSIFFSLMSSYRTTCHDASRQTLHLGLPSVTCCHHPLQATRLVESIFIYRWTDCLSRTSAALNLDMLSSIG